LGIRLHRDGDEGGHPAHQGGLAASAIYAGHHDQLIGTVDHFRVQQPLVGEVVIDRRSGQVGADRNLLESRAVITTLAENLASGEDDAPARIVRFRGWGTTRTATRRELHD
jgi:hypothetical protein